MAEEKDSIPIPMATAAAVPRSTLSPPEIEMQLHVINRQKLVKSLQQHLADSARPIQGIGGEEQNRYCTDHTELFRQESYFAYLFGVREPSFYGAVDVATGKSILFAPRLPAEYAVWLGKIKPLSHFTERYKVDMVCYVDMMEEVLHSLYKGEDKSLLFLLHGLNTDSGNFSKPADFEGIENFKTDLSTLHPILTECRVLKSKMELDIIQYANDISSEAHVETFMDGDMALLDMGAEYHFYGSDITCSFPVNGKFTVDQCLIYNAVLDAHNSVIAAMKPGVNWVNMHKLAEKVILEALKKGNIITGDIQDMMAQRLGAVFMPHGLGHLLGIDTHDPGGYPKGLERPKEPGLSSLRTARELKEHMVITVEPGCYFISALLIPAMESSETSRFFSADAIRRFMDFGGVRIESDVYVTSTGCKNMTNVPRETWEIEAVMAGAKWPIEKGLDHSQNGIGKFHS
uniref:Xaa-Pro dipeptidase n=1 Tax=Chenopodium quinoa TaxID=63459 RepID=A0A803MDB1_CHEQI